MRAALLLLLALAPAALAQNGSGGVDVVLAIPQGQFADRLDGVGVGLSGTLLYHVPNTPVGLGVEGAFVTYGREAIRTTFGDEPPLNRVEVDVETTNNIFLGHLVLRLQPPSGAFRPYGDALVGINYLFTESRIEDVDFGDDQDVASSTNFDDVAFSYGIGAGVMAQVFAGHSETGRPYALFIDARVRYLLGGEAAYLREGDIDADADGNPVYNVTASSTDLLLPQLGVTFRF